MIMGSLSQSTNTIRVYYLKIAIIVVVIATSIVQAVIHI